MQIIQVEVGNKQATFYKDISSKLKEDEKNLKFIKKIKHYSKIQLQYEGSLE